MLLSAEWHDYWLDVYGGRYDKPAVRRRIITKFRIEEAGIRILEAHAA